MVGILVTVHGGPDDTATNHIAVALSNFLNGTLIAAEVRAEDTQKMKTIMIHVGTRVRWD
jgi:hypothetical protein